MGELTQSFAQVTNAINQTKQTNLNRDIASSNISFRNQQSDIQERQFAAQQAQAQQQFQLDRADKAFDMASKLLTVAPPAEREGLMNGLLSSYAQATGKEYTPVQLAKYDETRAQLWGLGDQPEKAAEVVRQFESNSLPGDPNVQRLRNEFLLADVHNRKDNTGSLAGLNKLGRVMSQSSFDRAMEDPDKEMARALRDKKESGELNIVPDDLAMSLNLNEARDARFNALDPDVASKLIQIELGTLDTNMLSGDPEVDKLVATNNYLTGMDEIDAMLQANIVPPASKYRQVQRWAALADNKNLPSPVLSEQDREKMLASKAQREHLQKRNESITANINKINTQLGNNNLVVRTMLSKIDNIQQNTANAKIAGEAALLATEADRRKLEATAPEKIQRITEIDQELHEIGKVMGNPTALGQLQQDEVEALSDRMDLLNLEQEVLENTMAFASAKDPSLLLERRDNLKASTELLEAKKQELLSELNNNGKSLNGLQLSRLANLDQKTQIEADKAKGEEVTNQLSVQIDASAPDALERARTLINQTPGASRLTNPKRVVAAAGASKPLNVQISTGPTTASRTRAQETQDKGAMALNYLDNLDKTASSSTVGGVGKLRSFVQGLGQQASAFTKEFKGDRNRAIATIAEKGGDIDESIFFDKELTRYQMQARLAAFFMADAIADQSGRALSDADRKIFEQALGFNQTFTGVEQVKESIQTARELLQEKLKIAGKRLGEAPAQESSLPDMSEATDEDLMKILQGAFQ